MWLQIICWAGLIFLLVTLIPAWGYAIPPEVELTGYTNGHPEFEFTGADDFSRVPWWVRMWKEFGLLPALGAGLFLWGALKGH